MGKIVGIIPGPKVKEQDKKPTPKPKKSTSEK